MVQDSPAEFSLARVVVVQNDGEAPLLSRQSRSIRTAGSHVLRG